MASKKSKAPAEAPAEVPAKKSKKVVDNEESKGRGRKAVLTGLTAEQGRKARRALRAKNIKLSELGEGAEVAATVKDGVITMKVGKETVTCKA